MQFSQPLLNKGRKATRKDRVWESCLITPPSYIASLELGLHNINSCMLKAPFSNLVSLSSSYGGIEKCPIGKCQNPIFSRFGRNWKFQFWHFPILTLSDSDTFQFWRKMHSDTFQFWHFPVSPSAHKLGDQPVCQLAALCPDVWFPRKMHSPYFIFGLHSPIRSLC